ncbi:hypothetical protein [Providencia heimbachae]|uniref:hypothetical protein n=1 Tax=Providencia heimbachae TaxID=333962 RepID=UPI000837EE91
MGVKVKGIQSVMGNINSTLQLIATQTTARVMQEISITGAAHAALLTPIDTSNLINSQYRQLSKISTGYEARVGYSANYAAAVSQMKGKLKGQPREDFGKTQSGISFGGGTGKGNYWDPNAEPDFLRKGFENAAPEIQEIIKRAYKI